MTGEGEGYGFSDSRIDGIFRIGQAGVGVHRCASGHKNAPREAFQ